MVLVNVICPSVMILVAMIMKCHPQKYRVNASNGYSTPRARASKEAWDYAQAIAPDIFAKWGSIALIVCLVMSIVPIPFLKNNSESISWLIGIVALVNAFINVEQKLERF